MRGIWPFSQRDIIWIDSTTTIPENYVDIDRARVAVSREIDRHGFDWQVFLVSASGFFTDSYALFATNVILPSLGFLYWPDVTDGSPELIINCVTLAGSMVGQLLFGFLADKYGRRRLYGLELVLVIFSTLGMAQASTGINNSMNVLGWIVFWRFFMGLAIGAEYPLSAVITAEFADVNARARMMAAVFLMQPLGQLCAAGVGWAVLASLGGSRGLDSLPPEREKLSPEQFELISSTIDTIWRCVIGVGAFPAFVAIIYRVSIPESPRYTMDVVHDGHQAFYDIRRYHHIATDEATAMTDIGRQLGAAGDTSGSEPPDYFTYEELKKYFWDQNNWLYLFSTSVCWFLLDFAFYGLGINNPRLIAAIWAPTYPASADLKDWQNPFDPSANMYYELFDNARQYIITISIGSMLGSIALIIFIDKFRRNRWLAGSFLALALFFIITAATLSTVEFQPAHPLTIALYIICQFLFNVGPNGLTFIIPAEIFPTQYRCTCHGISAALGKLGSIFVQLVLKGSIFTSNPAYLGKILGAFAALMAMGAFIAWAWLPNVQREPEGVPQAMTFPILPSKSLEILGKGRAYAVGDPAIDPMTNLPGGEGQILSLKLKLHALFTRLFDFRKRVVVDSNHELPERGHRV